MAIKNLWKKNESFRHLPRFYGCHVIPETYLKFEYFDKTLEDYIK